MESLLFTIKKSAHFLFKKLGWKSSYQTKRNRYLISVLLSAICLAMLFSSGVEPNSILSTPLVSATDGSYQSSINKEDFELFSFAPGYSSGKLELIDYDKLSTLAFYDVPLRSNGYINDSSEGYLIYRNEYSAVRDNAKVRKIKTGLTLTALDNDTIQDILDNSDSVGNLASDIKNELASYPVDQIVLDFEYKSDNRTYREKFLRFVSTLSSTLKSIDNNPDLGVAILSVDVSSQFYDLKNLANKVDKVFMISSDFAPLEVNAGSIFSPLHGYKEADYWAKVDGEIEDFLKYVPHNKLVLERAWYGNGESYPFRPAGSKEMIDDYSTNADISFPLSSSSVERVGNMAPQGAQASAKKNVSVIAEALKNEGILSSNVLAYALATIEHETAGTFEPISEIKGARSARRLGYEGGTDYYGRGFVQLTHLRNYKKIGQRIGLGDNLVRDPELASKPEISAKILAAFFKDNGVARLAGNGSFVAARKPVNPDSFANYIAQIARKYRNQLG